MVVTMEEVGVFCPKCKTFETLWFIPGVAIRAQRFRQEGDRIYHDCGSDKPCRLLPRKRV